MKKLLLILTFLIISCGDNDDSDALSIEGRWNLSSIEINGWFESDSCYLMDYIVITGIGSGVEYSYGYDLLSNLCQLDDTYDVSYSKNPNLSNTFSFTITYGANDDYITGEALVNENTLVFVGSYPFEQDEVYEIIYTRE